MLRTLERPLIALPALSAVEREPTQSEIEMDPVLAQQVLDNALRKQSERLLAVPGELGRYRCTDPRLAETYMPVITFLAYRRDMLLLPDPEQTRAHGHKAARAAEIADLTVQRVRAPEVLQAAGVFMVSAYPIALLEEVL